MKSVEQKCFPTWQTHVECNCLGLAPRDDGRRFPGREPRAGAGGGAVDSLLQAAAHWRSCGRGAGLACRAHGTRVNAIERDGCNCMLHAHAPCAINLHALPPRPWQIRFDVPVCITQVRISDASKSGASGAAAAAGPAPLLRLFARDIYALSCSRFAPLCSSTISCTGAQPSTYKTEVCSAALGMTCGPAWLPSRVSQRPKDVPSKGCLNVITHSRAWGGGGAESSAAGSK